MQRLRGTYVHRGDALRRRARIKRYLLGAGMFGVALGAWDGPGLREARAESAALFGAGDDLTRTRAELEAARGELDLANAQLQRWNSIYKFSSRYRIGADLAASIHDVALAEGIEPELAFRLVKVESQFNERATSPVGAIGLTQLMLPTARYFEKGVTRERLYDRETNLRIGFRYLRTLVREYKGDVRLALLVYNRGPLAVETLRGMGLDPSNGYDASVMKGYSGRGVVD
jgi:soluble lytic murein transglycosylase-like protein